ncbi:MAG: hypothetical protein AB7K63_06970 [Vicinamibacterales bacterium]
MRLCFSLLILLVAAVPAAAQEPDPDEIPWTVTVKLTGGPNDYDREISLTHLGAVTAIDRKASKTVTEQLSDDELLTMSLLARGYAPNDLVDATCTNCIAYVLSIDANGRIYSVSFTERQLASSGAETLVRAMRRILTRMLVLG